MLVIDAVVAAPALEDEVAEAVVVICARLEPETAFGAD